MRNAHFFRRHQHQVAHSRRCIDGEIWILVEVSGDVVEISIHAPQMDPHHMQLGIVGEHTITRFENLLLGRESGSCCGTPLAGSAWQVATNPGRPRRGWRSLTVPKHRSRRLSPRIGQNLAQTIADGEIFTCS